MVFERVVRAIRASGASAGALIGTLFVLPASAQTLPGNYPGNYPAAPSSQDPPATASVLTAGPAPMEPADVPSTRTVSRINRPLFFTSAILLGGSYTASVLVGARSTNPNDHRELYIPVAGPWMDYNARVTDDRGGRNEMLNRALLIGSGVGQGLGAIGLIVSLVTPEKSTRHWLSVGKTEKLQFTPTSVGTGYGFGAVGRF